jgi:tetratricopeptide (TPR) repeat protein
MSVPSLPTPTVEEADALFQAENWAEAIRAYATLTALEPSNARLWYRLGMAYQSSDNATGAVKALEQAVALGRNPVVGFQLACAYARQGQTEPAFAALTKAIQRGFRQIDELTNEPALAPLRDDPRFPALVAEAERRAKPGLHDPKYREFDFWVGEWDVTSQGQHVATSRIERLVDGCLILENYAQIDGFSGKSMNFYDATLSKWRQVWADSSGSMSEYAGEVRDNAMHYRGAWHKGDGSEILSRMTFFNLGPTQVRQLGEQSTDGGATWQVAYDLLYTRQRN